MTGGKRFDSGAWAVVLVTLVAVLLVTALFVRNLHADGALNEFICGGECGPEAVAAPAGLELAGVPGSTVTSAPLPSRMFDADVSSAVARALDDAKLGDHVGVAVSDFAGTTVTGGDTGAFVPASTTKLLTAFAALRLLGPEHRFETRVLREGSRIVLVGGGDPYLDTRPPDDFAPARQASVAELATRAARVLKDVGVTRVQVGYDAALFEQPQFSPTWEEKYRRDVVAPVSALSVDGAAHGARYDDDPPQVAADRFAAALKRNGIRVTARLGQTSVQNATQVAVARSATVAQIVESVDLYSDNQGAEILLRHIAIADGRAATFDEGTRAVVEELDAAGIDTAGLVLHDGSGLSRDNRIAPETLTAVLVAAARSDRTASLLTSLPVAGVSGSLARRFGNDEAAAGFVRGKTGTLDRVHSLAGIVTTADGNVLAFAVMADRAKGINGFLAQVAVDSVAAALAGCNCGS